MEKGGGAMPDTRQKNNELTQPSNDLDYDYWGRMPGWTISEAAALLLDINPDFRRTGNGKEVEVGTKEWEFGRLRHLLKRARKMDELSSPMSPREFLQWATSNGLRPSEQLTASVKSGKPLRNWRAKYFNMKRQRDDLRTELEDSVSPKERTSLLKIVLGMAKSKFNHREGSPHTVGAIERALNGVELSVSDDVIRKYLAEADDKFAK
jgi:hypothetical protein